MNICKECKHVARGHAIDLRKWPKGHLPPGPRSSRQGGDYICAREGLTPPPCDPVTGARGCVMGPDCRDLNPAGECTHFEKRSFLSQIWKAIK